MLWCVCNGTSVESVLLSRILSALLIVHVLQQLQFTVGLRDNSLDITLLTLQAHSLDGSHCITFRNAELDSENLGLRNQLRLGLHGPKIRLRLRLYQNDL